MGRGDLPERVTFSSEKIVPAFFPSKAGGQAGPEDLLGMEVPQGGLAASTGLPGLSLPSVLGVLALSGGAPILEPCSSGHPAFTLTIPSH